MKTKRHAKILEIIRREDVGTQEELSAILNHEGYQVTQATVSRDIRELKLTKVAAGDHQKYVLFGENKDEMDGRFSRVFKDGTVMIDSAQNILIIKTVAGMAMAVAAALDAMEYDEIVGSIAGDDTIMCAVRTTEETEQLKLRLRAILSEA